MKNIKLLLICFVFLHLPVFAGLGQQLEDPDFHPLIENPSYTPGKGPKVYIDEAHNDFHTLEGRLLLLHSCCREMVTGYLL